MEQKHKKKRELELKKESSQFAPKKIRESLVDVFTNEVDYFLNRNSDGNTYKIIRTFSKNWTDDYKGTCPVKIKESRSSVSIVLDTLEGRKEIHMDYEEISALYEILKFYSKLNNMDLLYNNMKNINPVNHPNSYMIWPEEFFNGFTHTESFIGASSAEDIERIKINYILTDKDTK